MSTKLASPAGPLKMNITGYAAGIFADMSVDGPEIGTLVLVVDRAKNLPNKKTMGKQNPYCAARLGKEAKKTETDKRGGQTPRWDQELRFTVHDSADYHQLKVSVFSEDKRTDLIGEAWVSLAEVLSPGGGKSDIWQGLNCKGKYAGEIRLELTYYDSRPKPENRMVEDVASHEKTGSASTKVKRRPLPGNPSGLKGLTPDTIPDPAVPVRAKHGPREYKTSQSKPAVAPEPVPSVVSASSQAPQASYENYPSPTLHSQPAPSAAYSDQHRANARSQYAQQYAHLSDDNQNTEPDFLPQLPPTSRQRAVLQEQQALYGDANQRVHQRQHSQPHPSEIAQQRYHAQQPPPLQHSYSVPVQSDNAFAQQSQGQLPHDGHPTLVHHSFSAPVVPHAQESYDDYAHYADTQFEEPESLPVAPYHELPTRRSRSEIYHDWQDSHQEGPPHYRQPYVEDDDGTPPPPPPPAHSSSAPAVPQFDSSAKYSAYSPIQAPEVVPSQFSNQYTNSPSQLQDVERRYALSSRTTPQRQQARGHSMDAYGSAPMYTAQQSTPPSLIPGQRVPIAAKTSPVAHAPRHSIGEAAFNTPTRPHPLSHELPRERSPHPIQESQYRELVSSGQEQPYQEYRGRDPAPLVKSRAISRSPGPSPKPRSPYEIQHPIRGFESSDENPLSTSNRQQMTARVADRSTPIRKSVSPRPVVSGGGEPRTSIPYSPDSYEVHNPSSRNGGMPANASPHNPYQIKQGAEQSFNEQRSGPITGWDGREIDPSDHLPVDSWAPEPEKKTPTKTYGLGRDRDFGPRSKEAQIGNNPSHGGHRLSKDTVVNFRTNATGGTAQSSRNWPQKSGPSRNPVARPLAERQNFNNTVPNPYAQQEYSRHFHGDQYEKEAQNYGDGPYVLQHERGYSLPAIPPKVPIQQRREQYDNVFYPGESGVDALSREISSIDIDAGGRRSRPGNSPLYSPGPASSPVGGSAGASPTHYMPVRSHRDRNTVYH